MMFVYLSRNTRRLNMERVRSAPVIFDSKGRRVQMGVFLCHKCGKEVIRRAPNGKRDKSCGCCRSVSLVGFSGESGTRLGHIYTSMIRRCCNPSNDNYHWYGGRGIAVCPEWLDNFQNFKKWALSSGYTDLLELDRLDGDGDYEPNNCQWLSHTDNVRKCNQTKLKMSDVASIKGMLLSGHSQTRIAEIYGVTKHAIQDIKRGKTWRDIPPT
jgi:hypothetical protein